jgi:CheY-like chemotaxis protein
MQGTIGVESVPGEGSLFWCEVEFAIGTLSEEDTAAGHLPASWRGLVVDDNPLARSTLQTQLEALGVRAEAVGGATPALAGLRRAIADGDPYAFAFVDVDMPDIDGLSLANAIKSDQALAGTRLLMLTAMDTPIQRKTQQRVGFEMQHSKPVRQSQLPDTLRRLMGCEEPDGQGAPLATSAVPGVEARPLRVLVVEDQPVAREVMQIMLQWLGCEVLLAGSADEALDFLDEQTLDLVFMDCLMPGMDGYQATAAIRRHEPDNRRVVIIAMTALAVEGERERCLAAGMDDYLCKPVSEEMLGNTLNRWFPGGDNGDENSGNAALTDGDAAAAFRRMQAAGPEQTARLVDLFLDNTARSLAAMREMLEQGDGQELAKTAHALKGACLQLGVTRMADLCTGVEDAGHSGDQGASEAALIQLSEAFELAGTELTVLKTRAARVG